MLTKAEQSQLHPPYSRDRLGFYAEIQIIFGHSSARVQWSKLWKMRGQNRSKIISKLACYFLVILSHCCMVATVLATVLVQHTHTTVYFHGTVRIQRCLREQPSLWILLLWLMTKNYHWDGADEEKFGAVTQTLPGQTSFCSAVSPQYLYKLFGFGSAILTYYIVNIRTDFAVTQ